MEGESELAYFNAHAPRCISELHSKATHRPPAPFDGHGEPLNSYFDLACPKCAAAGFIASGRYCFIDTGQGVREFFCEPITLTCAGCGRSSPIFDPKTDGYDAEACDFGGVPTEGRSSDFVCSCGSKGGMSQVVARFEYPGDLFEMDIVEDGSRRAENLFSWFSLVGVCKQCEHWVEIFEHECA
jgi:hypothetical protein